MGAKVILGGSEGGREGGRGWGNRREGIVSEMEGNGLNITGDQLLCFGPVRGLAVAVDICG